MLHNSADIIILSDSDPDDLPPPSLPPSADDSKDPPGPVQADVLVPRLRALYAQLRQLDDDLRLTGDASCGIGLGISLIDKVPMLGGINWTMLNSSNSACLI